MANRLTGSATLHVLRFLRVQQEVVERALRQQAVQVPLVEVVQREVHAVRERTPLLAEDIGPHPRLHGSNGPADEGREELLRLGADVRESHVATGLLDL